jgi:hypothetical protein
VGWFESVTRQQIYRVYPVVFSLKAYPFVLTGSFCRVAIAVTEEIGMLPHGGCQFHPVSFPWTHLAAGQANW